MGGENSYEIMNYPDQVIEFIEKWRIPFKEFIAENDIKVSDAIITDIIIKHLGDKLLNTFLTHGEVYLEFDNDDEFTKCMSLMATDCILQKLKSQGLVDSIEDESGEEVFWSTEVGREVSKQIIENTIADDTLE